MLINSRKLNLFERFSIYRHGKSDAEKGQFRNENTGLPLPSSEENPSQQIISQFILTQISEYASKRDFFLSNCSYFAKLTYDERKGNRWYLLRFANAVSELNRQINNQQSSIDNFLNTNTQLILDYQNSSAYYRESNAEHLAIMYDRKAAKLKNQIQEEMISRYTKLISLLNEKIRLFELASSRITSLRAHYHLRVCYYYQIASIFSGEMSLQYISEDDFYNICERQQLFDYPQELQNAIDQRDVLMQKIGEYTTSESSK